MECREPNFGELPAHARGCVRKLQAEEKTNSTSLALFKAEPGESTEQSLDRRSPCDGPLRSDESAYQPMSLRSLKVRSRGTSTECVRSPLMAGSMSILGDGVVS